MALIAAGIFGFSSSHHAANIYWDAGGAADTNFTTLANWNTASDGTGVNPGVINNFDIAYFNITTLNTPVGVRIGALTIGGFVFRSTGLVSFNTDGSNRAITLGTGGITINAGAGPVTFGTITDTQRITFTLGGTQTWRNDSGNLLSLNNNNTINLGANILTFSGAGNITTGTGIISGAGGGLVKEGTGVLTLGAANTFTTGGFRLNAGTVVIGNNAAFGAPATSRLTINGGVLNANAARTVANAVTMNNNFAFEGAGTLLLSGAVTLGNNVTINATNSTLTIGGVIGDGGSGFGITKTGLGTLIFSNSAPSTYTGMTTVNAGTLTLGFGAATTPGSGVIRSGNGVTLGGGALVVKGKASSTSVQNLGSITLTPGASQLLGDTSETSAILTLSLGTLALNTANTALLIGKVPGVTAGTLNLTSTTNKDATGIYGGRVVFSTGTANTGYEWATTSSGSSPYTLSAYAGYSALALGAGTDTLNSRITASQTLTGSRTTNTLKIEDPATAGLTLALGANTLTLNGGGLLFTGTRAFQITGTSGATRLTAGSGSNYELIIHQYSTGALTNTAVIGDNAGNAVSVLKAGPGQLVLTGANTFTGGLRLGGGTLVIGNNQFMGNGGAFTIDPGTTLNATADFNATFNRPIQLNGDFTFTGSGNLNLGTGNVTLGNHVRITVGARTLTLGGAIDDGVNTYDFAKAGAGTLRLTGTNTYGGTTYIHGGVLQAVEGVGLPTNYLTLNGGVFEALGGGTFTRSLGMEGANYFRWETGGGGFSASGGKLIVNIGGNLTPDELVWGVAAQVGSRIVGNLIFGSTTANAETEFVNRIDLNAVTRTINVVANAGVASTGFTTISGVIRTSSGTAGLTKTGAGTLKLTGNNTYNGTTLISGGAIQAVAGVGLPTTGNLSLNGGVFEALGGGTFTRTVGTAGGQVQWTGASGGGFSAVDGKLTVNIGGNVTPDELIWGPSGSFHIQGPLMFGSVTANNEVEFLNRIDLAGAARTITNIVGTTTLSGVIRNSSGTAAGLTLSGTGTLNMSVANTYDGGTTMGGAGSFTLVLGDNQALGTGSAFTWTAGTLAASKAIALSYNVAMGGNNTITGANDITLNGTFDQGNASRTLTVNNTGTTILNGNVTLTTGGTARTLTLAGSGNLTVNGLIQDGVTAASALAVTSTGQVTLNNANTFTGTFTLNTASGTLIVGDNNALGGAGGTPGAFTWTAGTVQAGGGARAVANNVTFTAGAISGANDLTLNGTFTVAAGTRTLMANTTGGAEVTLAGNVYLSSTDTANRSLTIAGAGPVVIDGVIANNNAGNTLGAALIYSGTSVLTLNNDNTFTGGLTINTGQVVLGHAGALNSTVNSENAVTFGNASEGILTLNGNSIVVRSLTSSNNATAAVVENAHVNNAVLTVGNTAGDSSTFAGVIRDGAGGGTLGLTKEGTGFLYLTGTNTYTGATAVNAGLLGLLYKISNPTDLTVANGARLVLGVGAVGQWEAADIADVVANSLSANSSFGLDTTLGNFTYSGDLSDFEHFYKFGTNTLYLSGTSTFGGNAYVLGGALRAEWGVGLPDTANLVLSNGVWETSSGTAWNLGTGGGQFQLVGPTGGFSAVDNPLTVNLGNDGQTIVWGTDTFKPGVLLLNYFSANTNLTFVNPINLNGLARTISVESAVAPATMVGNIFNSGAAAVLVKVGSGTLVFETNAVTLTGLTVNQGTLTLRGATVANSGANIIVGGLASNVAVLTFAGTTTADNNRQILIGNAAGAVGVLTFTDQAALTGFGSLT
ncbi:MAG: hypothetical protein FJ395_15560, partial [Verrucomicrobia bacterium]|nr:hypothetical protein [Verrucomicrobiota bacterium]